MENHQLIDFPSLSIFSGMTHCKRLYDFTPDETSYLENAKYVLRQTGGVAVQNYYTEVQPIASSKNDPLKPELDKFIVDLPCNLHCLDAVTSIDIQYWNNYRNYSTNTTYSIVSFTGLNTYSVFPIDTLYYHNHLKESINERKFKELVNYQVISKEQIEVAQVIGESLVGLWYSGYVADKDGFPLINEKHALAIGAYCGLIEAKRRYIQMVHGADRFLQLATADYNQFVQQARSITYASDNMHNQILDQLVRWDRKQFHVDHKFIK